MSEQTCRWWDSWICEVHWPKDAAALTDERLHPLRPAACSVGLAALRAELTETVKELHEWESRAVDFKAQRDDQARVIGRLRDELAAVMCDDASCPHYLSDDHPRRTQQALSPTPTEG